MKKHYIYKIISLYLIIFIIALTTKTLSAKNINRNTELDFITSVKMLESYYNESLYEKEKTKLYLEYFNNIKKEKEEEFYKERIPKEFADAFLYYTQDCKNLRLPFYAIMFHESGNFKSYVNKNLNGTYDLGPSQLNTSNMENARFRELYNPKDESHVTTKYCFYMVMTINFFKDLVYKYGIDNAIYCYNGGEKALSILESKSLSDKYKTYVNNITNYHNSVSKYIEKFQIDFNNYMEYEKDLFITEGLNKFNEEYCKVELVHKNFYPTLYIQSVDKFSNEGINNLIAFYK